MWPGRWASACHCLPLPLNVAGSNLGSSCRWLVVDLGLTLPALVEQDDEGRSDLVREALMEALLGPEALIHAGLVEQAAGDCGCVGR